MQSPGKTALAVAAVLLLAGCSRVSGYDWAWYIILPVTDQGRTYFFYLISGFRFTIELSIAGFALGVVIGLVLALLGRSQNPIVQALIRGYLSLLRAIPTFVLLLWIYYALPVILQSLHPDIAALPILSTLSNLSARTAAVVTLALSSGAFLSEIFRAGIESVPKGHVEAALALGMTQSQTMRRIVLPQALRRMLPPTASQFVQTVKDSALASTIGFRELTRRASELQNITFRPLELYTFLALEYLIIILALSYLVRQMERRIVID
jgi:His/Glu/Gln/Arg/opine family amino acid ABC transporter permease subunit